MVYKKTSTIANVYKNKRNVCITVDMIIRNRGSRFYNTKTILIIQKNEVKRKIQISFLTKKRKHIEEIYQQLVINKS